VSNVSFSVAKAELLALIGPNGAGKTTCFNMLMGQLAPTAGEVLLNGENITGMAPRKVWRKGIGRRYAHLQYKQEAMQLLELVGMQDQAERASAVLAYGDLKRLELSIALAHHPILLLMDEPTAGMAPKERIALMELTANIVEQRQISALFTEHDMDVVFANAHRIMVLNRGELIANGSVDEVRANAEVQEVYLGGGNLYHDVTAADRA